MLSLETAKKLKSAGLRWDAAIGDRYYICYPRSSFAGESIVSNKDLGTHLELDDKYIFAPRLEQLLAEIEKRGYHYQIIYNNHPMEIAAGYAKYWCILHDKNDEDELRWKVVFRKNDDMVDEAAAQALLWILEQEEGE